MSMEAGVLVALDGTPLHWHLPPGREAGYLPDSRSLWDVIWENRDNIQGFAHSHPGGGVPGTSHEDVTTFAAIEAALGKRLTWWIISHDALVTLRWAGPGKYVYSTLSRAEMSSDALENIPWLRGLWAASYGQGLWELQKIDAAP